MELRRLLDSLHGINFPKHLAKKASFIEQFKRSARVAFGQHPREFVAHTLLGDLVNLRSELLNSGERRWLNCVFEPRRKTHRSQHTQLVFSEAYRRIPNGANR